MVCLDVFSTFLLVASLQNKKSLSSLIKEFSPSEEKGSDEVQETNDETQEILTDSDDPSYATSESSTPQ